MRWRSIVPSSRIVEPNRSDESVNGLLRNKIRVIQALHGYRVSQDALILTWFANPQPCERILDAGTGCGVIAFGLAVREASITVIGLEIQKDLADRAARGVKLNGLELQIMVVRGDVRLADRYFRHNSFDAVVSNPPYHEPGRGKISLQHEKALSRHQLMMPLDDLVMVSGALLKPRGRLSVIYPVAGLGRVKQALEQAGFKLSRMLWIHPHEGAEPGHVCLESRLHVHPSHCAEGRLYLYNGPNERTRDAEAIFAGEAWRIYHEVHEGQEGNGYETQRHF
jgi:tRNA1Val (adenine37-N6)-methyltransferase